MLKDSDGLAEDLSYLHRKIGNLPALLEIESF
jgi:hypothetical protein